MNTPDTAFFGLGYPCLILGPMGIPFRNAETAWLAHFLPNRAVYIYSVVSEIDAQKFIQDIQLFERMEQFPKDYWFECAYKILLQKYEKTFFAKKLLAPQYSPDIFPYLFPVSISSPAIDFWYDTTLPFKPSQRGHLGILSARIRRELLEKYRQLLLAKHDIGRFIRAHHLDT